MAPPVIYVAIWDLSNGRTVPTLTTEATYRKWLENPSDYAERRIRRWNSPNRKSGKLPSAVHFKVVQYAKMNGSSGSVLAAAS